MGLNGTKNKLFLLLITIITLQIIFPNYPTSTEAGMKKKLKKLKEILPLLLAMKKKKIIIIPIPIPLKMNSMSSWGDMGGGGMMMGGMDMSSGWNMMMSGGGGGGWGGGMD